MFYWAILYMSIYLRHVSGLACITAPYTHRIKLFTTQCSELRQILKKKHSAQNDQMIHSDKKCSSKNKRLKRVSSILYKHLQHSTTYLN